MKTRRQAAGGLAVTAIVALALTAACGASARSGSSTLRVSSGPNGEAAKTGPQVLADATRALAAVPAVRLTGTSTADGEPEKLDLRVQADGVAGTMQAPGGTEQLLIVKGQVYFKGELSPLASSDLPKSVVAELAGRWLSFDGTETAGNATFSGTTDGPMNLKGLASSLGKLDPGVTIEPAVATDTLDGHPVVVISDSKGSRMFVSATGEPLPLKVIGKGGGDSGLGSFDGDATFTYGDDPVKLQVPSGAVSLQKLFEKLLPSAFPTDYPSGFPTDFPSDFPSDFASFFPSPGAFPTDFPSGFPSALASELRSFAAQGGAAGATATPAPTP